MHINWIRTHSAHGSLPYPTFEQEPTPVPELDEDSRVLTGLVNGLALAIGFWIGVGVLIFAVVRR
jgi:hypothetical protein